MSATNRGAVRKKDDFYETPEEVTRDFLFNHFEGDFKRILEPCAGTGKMVKVLREKYPDAEIHLVEPFPSGRPFKPGADAIFKCKFEHLKTKLSVMLLDYDLIFTNPPYSQAKEIIEHALTTWPYATVVMLLRLNFLGSQKRHDFWQAYPPNELHVLSCRPSFTGRGTDATEYAWFVWRTPRVMRPGRQKINVIWGREE